MLKIQVIQNHNDIDIEEGNMQERQYDNRETTRGGGALLYFAPFGRHA
jgi:hypothetical protein